MMRRAGGFTLLEVLLATSLLAAALALNARPAHYRLPEERPYIG